MTANIATTYSLGQLKVTSYQVLVLDTSIDNGADNYQDISSLCTSIQWDYDLDQASEKYTLNFVRVADIVNILKPLNHIIINAILVYAAVDVGSKFEPLKYGVIVDTSIRPNAKGEIQITAYDIAWYLSVNKSSHALKSETASSFITRICKKYLIPTGLIEDTKTVIGPSVFMERTLWDMFVTTLALTRDVAYKAGLTAQGKTEADTPAPAPQFMSARYFLRTYYNTITLQLKKDPDYVWKFETNNLFSASAKWNAEAYRNYVQVFGRQKTNETGLSVMDDSAASPDGDISALGWAPQSITTDPDIKKYGLLAESVSLAGASDPALNLGENTLQANYQAQQLLSRLRRIAQTATISTVNINTLGPGDAILLEEPISGLVGKYYVKSGSHKVTAQSATMDLTLNLEDLLPEAYKTVPESTTPLTSGVLG